MGRAAKDAIHGELRQEQAERLVLIALEHPQLVTWENRERLVEWLQD